MITKDQALILTGYTGISCVMNFDDFEADAARRLGRPLCDHGLSTDQVIKEIKELYKSDFEALVFDSQDAIILSGFTGFMFVDTNELLKDISARLNRQISETEMIESFSKRGYRYLYKTDFISLLPKEEN